MRRAFTRNLIALTLVLLPVMCPAYGALANETLGKWTRGRTPPLVLKDSQGQAYMLTQYAGQVVLVNFWATWCEPCVEEMPALEKLKQAMQGQPFVVLAVNLGEGEARMNAFAQKANVTFPLLLDRDGVARRDWKIQGAPATFVIDGRGQIRYWHVGALDFSDGETRAKIAGLIKNAKKQPDRKKP